MSNIERQKPGYDSVKNMEDRWSVSFFSTEGKSYPLMWDPEAFRWEKQEVITDISLSSGHPDAIHILSKLEETAEGEDFGTEYTFNLKRFSMEEVNLSRVLLTELEKAQQDWAQKPDRVKKYRFISMLKKYVKLNAETLEAPVPAALETPRPSKGTLNPT